MQIRSISREALIKSAGAGSEGDGEGFTRALSVLASLVHLFQRERQGGALVLVFNKTVKNRFIRLLFQQPAA